MHELIRDITLCILFAWMLGLLAHFSRQPLILAYLIAGFCIGPFGAGWVKSEESISVISELGLILLLFANIRANRGHFTTKEHRGVEIPGIYWHFVDVMWIVVFTSLYIL